MDEQIQLLSRELLSMDLGLCSYCLHPHEKENKGFSNEARLVNRLVLMLLS